MIDYISRAEIQDYIAKYLSQYLYDDVRSAVEVIDEYIGELPSADVRENTHAHWEMRYPTSKQIQNCTEEYFCSNCKSCNISRGLMRWYSFCPNCGADMRGGK